MRNGSWAWLGIVLATSVLAALLPAPGSADTLVTHLRVLPADGSYRADVPLTVEVYVQDVVDLYGADVQLRFDPTLFQVRDADPARPGIQIVIHDELLHPDLRLHQEADPETGRIWYAATQLNTHTPEPAQGSGRLFSFTVDPLRTGLGAFAIVYQELSTRDGELIPVVAHSAVYWITQDGLPPALPWLTYAPLVTSGRSP